MLNGTLKFFDDVRFFGFIEPDDGSGDVFVHGTALRAAGVADPRPGDRYTYALEMHNGRSRADVLYRTEAARLAQIKSVQPDSVRTVSSGDA